MTAKLLFAEVRLKSEYYDVDAMKVVWHGNYVKYMEKARCALLDTIGFNYQEMEDSGYIWPIVSMKLKYIKPIFYNQEFIIRATLLEYKHRIRIGYVIIDPGSKAMFNKAETVQMAVDLSTGNSLLVSPPCLVNAVKTKIKQEEKS
ncbi:MAG: acyl-CoA thioesterase [Spirochaetales bacterium]|nr:acyl-CoA thioesterase [Spirochaetales bacterium]